VVVVFIGYFIVAYLPLTSWSQKTAHVEPCFCAVFSINLIILNALWWRVLQASYYLPSIWSWRSGVGRF